MTEPIFTNEVQARYADPADLARRTISRIDAAKNAEQRAREAANAAEAALGSHRRDYARGNRAVCTCGRTSHGRSAFQSLGLHIAAATKKGDKVWNETWAQVYDEQMEAWRHSLRTTSGN